MNASGTRYEVAALIAEGKLVIGDGYRAKNSDLGAAGLPFARAGNINDGFRFEGADRFPLENLSRVGDKVSQPGDVVFTSKGTVGRFAMVRAETERFVYSPQLCFWRSLDKELLDPRFLYYWMLGREFFLQYSGVAGQTDMAEYVSLGDQRRMHITLPGVLAQRAIAAILGALDDKSDLNRRMNVTLDSMAKALFKSWFVDFDPVRAKATGRAPAGMDSATAALFPGGFEGSDEELPHGWTHRALYDCAKWINGAAYRDFDFCPGDKGLPIIKIAELKAGVTNQTRFTLSNPGDKYLIDTGDLLFSWSGNPDTSIDTFVWARGHGWLNQHIFKVVTGHSHDRTFVLCLLRHLRPVFAEIARNKQTTGLGHVTAGDMKRLQVVAPPPDVLEAFHAVVGPLIDLMLANEKESLNLERIRNALLPKLLSGVLRIRDAEKAVEQVA